MPPQVEDVTEIAISLAEQRVTVKYLGDSMDRLEESWHNGMARIEEVLARMEGSVLSSEKRVSSLESDAKTLKGIARWGAGIVATVIAAAVLLMLKVRLP